MQQHFHILRWQAMQVPTGERITVADSDFAALASRKEADDLRNRLTRIGDRCTVLTCGCGSCTLHGVRGAVPTA